MMRTHFYIVLSFLVFLSGCTTAVMSERTAMAAETAGGHADNASVATLPVPEPGVMTTRYELGSYRYPRSAQGSREVAVERQTRVPANLGNVDQPALLSYVPVSFDPLPKSVELEAELATQREMTARIRTAQQAMVELEQRARGQFETLVAQTGETLRLREELEAERARVQRREAELSARLQMIEAAQPAPAVSDDSLRSPLLSKE